MCWAAGGLIVLSLVPTKRVDRIFPVMPPLCLLLVAALRRAEEAGNVPSATRRRGMLPPVFARSTGQRWFGPAPASRRLASGVEPLSAADGHDRCAAGSGLRAGLAFWQHADGLSRFGAQVRAATTGRRVELVAPQPQASDEALIVYLRRLEFVTPGTGSPTLDHGRVDALVLSEATLEKSRALPGSGRCRSITQP